MAGYGYYYETGEGDVLLTENVSNIKIKYLNGIDRNGKVGIEGCNSLKSLNFEGCDFLDCDYFSKYSTITTPKLTSVELKGNKNLTTSQVNLIVSLMSKISFSLDGIYVAYLDTNKESLNFENKHLTDLSFLDGNLTCKYLNVAHCDFDNSQVGYIGSMVNLEKLNINTNWNITDFSFLQKLTKLINFNASNTNITDEDLISYIQNKENIQLGLFNCSRINDLSWIDDFPSATFGDVRNWTYDSNADLSIFNSRGSTGSILINRGDLTTMQARISAINSSYGLHLGTNVNMLSKLENCTEITNLYMSSGDGENSTENGFSGENSLNLSKCTKLVTIYFKRNLIENLNVSGCTKLQKFTMYDMQRGNRSNVVDFSKNSELQKLVLNKNYYIQDDFILLCSKLTPVYDTSLNKLETGCPALTEIALNRNSISSLTPLSNLFSLEKLYIADNELVTLSGIENLVNLTVLDIRNNYSITNINPILELMANIKKEKGDTATLTVYISGCSGILNSTDDLVKEMKDVGVTIEK